MNVLRLISLLLFVVIALAMGAWQARAIYDLAALSLLPQEQGGAVMLVVGLVLMGVQWWLGRFVFSKLKWRATEIRAASVVAINIVLPLILAGSLGGGLEFQAGLAALAIQFFIYVDLHMGRALAHYFSSGGTAFVSLRYLRKRPVSLASVVGVAVGVGVLIVVNSIMNGFVKDYREQIRGSLSHVLMYLRPDLLAASDREIEERVWQYSIERVRADPAMAAQWEHAKAVAYQASQDERLPRYDDAPEARFPSGRSYQVPAGVQAPRLLQQLEEPVGVSIPDLAARLPIHPKFGPATPENILLAATFADADARNRRKAEVRAQVKDAIFLPRLEAGVRHVQKLAGTYPETEASSPRIRGLATLTDLRAISSVEDATVIVAVDPELEPQISNAGENAAAAELQTFKVSHHILPAIDLLEYLLLFESLEHGPSDSRLRAISVASDMLFAEADDEESLPPFEWNSPSGPQRLVANWSPGSHLLRMRRAADESGKVIWSQLDQIRWREGSPGYQLYQILRRHLKELAKSDQPEMLRSTLVEMQRELTEACEAWLTKGGVTRDGLRESRSVQVGPMRGYYRGDAAAVAFMLEHWLDGRWPLVSRISQNLRGGFVTGLRDGLSQAEADEVEIPAGVAEWVEYVSSELDGFLGEQLSAAKSRAEIISATRRLFARLRENLSDPRWAAGLNLARGAIDGFAPRLSTISDSEEFFLRLERSLPISEPLPDLIGRWDTMWAAVEARRNAYRTILPLRTRLLDGESVSEYLVRAKARLPLRTNNEFYSDSPAELAAAREYAGKLLRDGFVQHRLTAGAGSWNETLAQAPGLAKIAAALKSQAAAWAPPTGGSAVAEIQAAVERLRDELAATLESQLAGLSATEASAIRRHFRPLTEHSQREEYWRVRVDRPGLLFGEAMMQRRGMRSVGEEIQVKIFRQGVSRPQARDDQPQYGLIGDERFVVAGVYQSGLFAESFSTMYTDFASYAALLGETNAVTLVGVKLKDYAPWDGRPLDLKREFDSLVAEDRRALARDDNLPAPGSVEELEREAAGMLQHGWFGGVRVDIWELERAKLLQAVEREKTLLTLLLGLNMVLAGVVILIVVYLTVVEKVKDIGILKALGASPWGIRSVFMFNALFIGLFGTVMGGVIGYLISDNLNSIEDWIDQTFGLKLFPPDVYYLTYVPSLKGWPLVELAIGIGAPATLWAFFCGILPAVIASRKETVEALHYE